MRHLLDTGILVRLAHRPDPHHSLVRNALRRLTEEGHEFVTSTQNAAEFWNLCTRPREARGGFGLSIDEAGRRLRLVERLARVLREPASAYGTWKSLVLAHRVEGRQVHDARIAALMQAYRIRRVLTLNASDFARYAKIEAVTPQEVLAR